MFHVYFSMSTGLKAPIIVPKGWTEQVIEHVAEVESRLGIEREKYLDNPVHWKHPTFEWVSNEVLCETAEIHNRWVRRVYNSLATWSHEPIPDGEILTPEQAEQFWPGLEMIDVPPEQWTGDYYVERIKSLFAVMTKGEDEGVTFGARKLTIKQAAAVIHLFEQYLNHNHVNLEVPKGRDFLIDNYSWCEKCGAGILPEDIDDCRRKRCPLREEIYG